MAIATLEQIRAALLTALTAKLGTTDQQLSAYVLKQPTLPTIWIRLKPDVPITYHLTLGSTGGVQMWSFLVEAYCGDVGDVAAQKKLDSYVSAGSKSIVEALLADQTLGGIVQTLKVPQCNAYVEFLRADGTAAIGANWEVDVYP